jgi:hypothetical protein
MAAPNILNLNTATGKTTAFTPTGTTAVVLLRNPASSGLVLKVNSLVVSNLSASASIAATVSYYTNGGVAQGSAPSGGTAFSLVTATVIPATASLIVIDKTTEYYVEENASLVITSGTASNLTFSVSYEELS